jgi:hypothetical protein
MSLTMTAEGAQVLAGTVDGRCVAISVVGGELRWLAPTDTALVAELQTDAAHVLAIGFGTVSSTSDGLTWRPIGSMDDPARVGPAARDPVSGRSLVVSAGRLVDAQGEPFLALPLDAPTAVAVRDGPGPVVAVSDGEALWLHARDTPPLDAARWQPIDRPPGDRIVGLAFGSPGSSHDPSLVVATIADQGEGCVWIRSGGWRRLAASEASAGRVHLATVAGPRGTYAAIGPLLFRPATVGELLLAPETPDGPKASTIHGLAALRTDHGDVLAVLVTSAVLLSSSGGLDWDRVELPGGAPATAIDLRITGSVELVLARLGGEILTLTVG